MYKYIINAKVYNPKMIIFEFAFKVDIEIMIIQYFNLAPAELCILSKIMLQGYY